MGRPPSNPLDAPLVLRARDLAKLAHQYQLRRGNGAPYFTHLEAVALLLSQHGYHHDHTLAAAYLHDLVEDQPRFAPRMQQVMPRRVVDLVTVLSERKLDAQGRKRPKAERFAEYLAALGCASETTRAAIPISCADRLHNMLSIIEEDQLGRCAFDYLSTPPTELLEQLAALRRLYQPVVVPALLEAFDSAAARVGRSVDHWQARS